MVSDLKKHQGFVLIVALVFLVALTGVASALMLNTTSDMKMSGASQEKVIATQEALSAIDEIILIQTRGGNNLFAGSLFPDDGIPVAVTPAHTTGVIIHTNPMNISVPCPRSGTPSSLFGCNILRVSVTKNYGNSEASTIIVNAGVTQDLLDLN
jgi:hypothetical protein